MEAAILTVSDKGSRGERVDKSGEVLRRALEDAMFEVVFYGVVPDERFIIEDKLKHLADELDVELVLTTGGTGFSPRDVTPEATRAVIEKDVPGLAEVMRQESLKITPHAALSRAVSGIRGRTLIVNMPGSPKAASECFEVILPAIPHGLDILRGRTGECATPKSN